MAREEISLKPSDFESQTYLGGWSHSAEAVDVIEPATGELLTKIGKVASDQVAQAAGRAGLAQPAWEFTSFDERAAVLRRVAQLIEERIGELALWIMRETGSTRLKAEFELGASIRAVYEAAAMPAQPAGLVFPTDRSRLSYAKRRALGVVGVISPFNFPFFLSIRAISPALAIGNAAMLKPNPHSAISGGLLIAKLFEDAGLPADLLHVLPGDANIGEALCSDPNVAMIQFTGSTQVGRQVGELAGKHLKKVSLEMGGKNALIILDDADLDLAASNAAWASFMHQGQICFAAGRTLVHRSIIEPFTEKLSAIAKAIRVGDPLDDTVALGPLINDRQSERVERIVSGTIAAGATLHAGGKRDGLFYEPTVLGDVAKGMPAFDEEIFGPVAAITAFDSDEDAVALANDTEYGLSGAVISKSIGRALNVGERLNVGILHINDQTVGEEVVNPITGWGASGNGTGIGGPANWDEFSRWQWVTIKDEPPVYPLGIVAD